nr:hypothetical protein [Tanacetum cinerariifolium]
MCKDDKLRVMRVMLQRIMLLEQRRSRTRDMSTANQSKTDIIDAFDSNYDKAPATSAVFMENPLLMIHMLSLDDLNIEFTSDNNVISNDQYLKENENEVVQGKEHGQQLFDLVINGLFQFETVEVLATPNTLATTRVKTLDDLTPKEKIRQACDIKATNIVLQGLPHDVYTLVNNQKSYAGNVAKDNATGTEAIKNTRHVYCKPIKDIIDAFDSNYDKAPATSAVFMENPLLMIHMLSLDDLNIEFTSDNNVISNDQYLKENENEVVQGIQFMKTVSQTLMKASEGPRCSVRFSGDDA